MTTIRHFDLLPAATTGTDPMGMNELLHGSPLDDLKYSTQRVLWSGALDAPDLIVQGGVRAAIIVGEYEGTTPVTACRG